MADDNEIWFDGTTTMDGAPAISDENEVFEDIKGPVVDDVNYTTINRTLALAGKIDQADTVMAAPAEQPGYLVDRALRSANTALETVAKKGVSFMLFNALGVKPTPEQKAAAEGLLGEVIPSVVRGGMITPEQQKELDDTKTSGTPFEDLIKSQYSGAYSVAKLAELAAASVGHTYDMIKLGNVLSYQGLNIEYDRDAADRVIESGLELHRKFQEKYGSMGKITPDINLGFMKLPGITYQDSSGAPMSLGLMLSTLMWGATASAPVALTTGNPVAATATGVATSGAAMYRATSNLAFRDVHAQKEQESIELRGRGLSKAEFDALHVKYDNACRREGIIEAGIEMITMPLDFAIPGLGRAAKPVVSKTAQPFIKGLIKKIPYLMGSLTGVQVVEQAGEATTDYLQTWNKRLSGLSDEKEDILNSVKRTFGPTMATAFATGAMTTSMANAYKKINVVRNTRAETKAKKSGSSKLIENLKQEMADVIVNNEVENVVEGKTKEAEVAVSAEGQPLVQQPIDTRKPTPEPVMEPVTTEGLEPLDLSGMKLSALGKQKKLEIDIMEKEIQHIDAAIDVHEEVGKQRADRLFDEAKKNPADPTSQAFIRYEEAREAFEALSELKSENEETGVYDKAYKTAEADFNAARSALQAETEAAAKSYEGAKLNRFMQSHMRVEDLKAQRKELVSKIENEYQSLTDIMATEEQEGTKAAAQKVPGSTRVVTKAETLSRIEEHAWNKQLAAMKRGVKEGGRTALKYAKEAQRFLSDRITKSSLSPQQKLKIVNKLKNIQTPKQFDDARLEIRNAMKEIRAKNTQEFLKKEIQKIADQNPHVKATGKNKKLQTVPSERAHIIKAVKNTINLSKVQAEKAFYEAVARTDELNKKGVQNFTPEERMEYETLPWITEVADVMTDSSVLKYTDLLDKVNEFAQSGRDMLQEQRLNEQIVHDANIGEMVRSMEEGYGFENKVLTPEERAQIEKDKSAWQKAKDVGSWAVSSVTQMQQVVHRLSAFRYNTLMQRLLPDRVLKMTGDNHIWKNRIYNSRKEIYSKLDSMLTAEIRKTMRGIDAGEHITKALLDLKRFDFFSKTKDFVVNLERPETLKWGEESQARIRDQMKVAASQFITENGRRWTEVEKAQKFTQINDAEQIRMQRFIEDSFGLSNRYVKVNWRWTKSEMMGVYALSRNEKQLESITDPKYGRGIPLETVNEIVSSLTDMEKELVDRTSDELLSGSLFEEAKRVNQKIYNFAPKREQGYWPMRVDSLVGKTPGEDSVDPIAQYSANMKDISLGSMIERGTGNMVVSIDFEKTLNAHLADTIHFLSAAEAIHDMNAIIKDPRFEAAALNVITKPEYDNAFTNVLKDIANTNRKAALNAFESGLKHLRSAQTTAALAFSFPTIFSNFVSFGTLAHKLAVVDGKTNSGYAKSVSAMFKVLNDRVRGGGKLRAFIHAKSPSVKFRAEDMDAYLFNKARGVEAKNKNVRLATAAAATIKNELDFFFHYAMSSADSYMAEVSWLAAYESALTNENADIRNNPEAFADNILKETQAVYGEAFQPAVLRGSDYKKLILPLHVFFNQRLQSMLTGAQKAYYHSNRKEYREASFAVLNTFIAEALFPTMLGVLILKPHAYDDPDEIAKEMVRTVSGALPLGGDIAKVFIEHDYENVGQLMTSRAFASLIRVPAKILDPDAEVSAKDIIDLLGVTGYFPSSQVKRMVAGWESMEENDENSLLPLILGPRNWEAGRDTGLLSE